jgi:hypothetical protein
MQGMQIHHAAQQLGYGGAEQRHLRRGQDIRRCRSAVTGNNGMQQRDFSELSPLGGSSAERGVTLEDVRLYQSADGSRPMDCGGSSLWFLA